MGLLSKVLGGGQKEEIEVEAPPCPHTSLIQRWENANEMGKKELARYICTSCGETFSYEQAEKILNPDRADTGAARVFADEAREEEPSVR
ncbi:MAG: hypothetical protein E6J42_02040 [Chloroflexi bacterium]|nr:MAG: hypothetical protein E6J42_02040 [Chloroflexota bacterium]